jgi:capsular exopolysaccharide synthesis family protein
MGLISDALRKAEQQREESPARPESAAPVAESAIEPVAPDEIVDMPAAIRDALPGDARGLDDSKPRQVPDQGFRVDDAVIAYHDKGAEITEQYRALRARLTAQNSTGENQVIAITSSIPKEGKSVTTMNLSWVMSEIKHFRVLMIDGDFRRSSLAKMIGVSEYPGLADLLRGEASIDEVIRPTPLPNLDIITAGTTQEFNAAELLSGQKTGNILQMCRRRYQYTFIDTPPASTVSDACVLAPWCSGVLFVVRMGQTPEPVARSTVRQLQASNVNILGCILAGHCESSSRYHRYYGYYKYYSRYYSEPY